MTEIQFNLLYKEYNGRMLSIAKNYSSFWYKDIVQEAWIKVWRSWDKYRLTSKAPDIAMLKQITKSVAIDFIRREKNGTTDIEKEAPIDLIYELSIDRSIDIDNLNLKEIIKKAINRLPNIKLQHIGVHVFIKDSLFDDIIHDLDILGYSVDKTALYKDIYYIKKYLINTIKNWKVATNSKLKFEIDFELGD